MLDKEKFYFNRTLKHIHRVQNNMFYLITNFSKELELSLDDCRYLALQVLNHDKSKFNDIQFRPYIDFTWVMKNKEKMSDELKEKFNNAWMNHYQIENHHPIGFNNNKYDKKILLEIVCDLQAMSQEFNEKSCRKYFETKWKTENKKYFNEKDWIDVILYMDKAISFFEK